MDADPEPDVSDDPGDAARAAVALMARLRDPTRGCPWDVAQSFATIAPYTIEEAYEVADAIAEADFGALKDELGDLLFQVLFHARMAQEAGLFDFAAVCRGLVAKMTRRHPHVFGETPAADAAAVVPAWERLKAEERAARATAAGRPASLLDGVPVGLPGLTRAVKLQKRAARVGFDWPGPAPVIAKIREELGELEVAMAEAETVDTQDSAAPDPGTAEADASASIASEIGDLLFAVANLARHLGVDPESAIRGTNQRFTRRFSHVETTFGADLGTASLAAMEAAWTEAKRLERGLTATPAPSPAPVPAPSPALRREPGDQA